MCRKHLFFVCSVECIVLLLTCSPAKIFGIKSVSYSNILQLLGNTTCRYSLSEAIEKQIAAVSLTFA